jgi:hypothetical protein
LPPWQCVNALAPFIINGRLKSMMAESGGRSCDKYIVNVSAMEALCRYPAPSHPIPSHPLPSHPLPSHPILSHLSAALSVLCAGAAKHTVTV